MLIRTLKKIVRNSINSNQNDKSAVLSPKSGMKSPIIERKMFQGGNQTAPISKFPEETARKRLLNEKIQKVLDDKTKCIDIMECEKREILEELKQFYVEIIEMLKLDHVKFFIFLFLSTYFRA